VLQPIDGADDKRLRFASFLSTALHPTIPGHLSAALLPRDHHCQNSLNRKAGVQEGHTGRYAAGDEA